ncbi:hypothetical protein CENDO_00265 [Corynebacterium endometrii]|uniref:Uncharacterized protein n=1 Tax=Corynebacterium endometrii TaxID=2488819 RepID=A0A4P7QDD1_9CORY|nr:hypothetical protein CENDO_00265 [Corynebacterium endometrii]
MAYAGLGFVLGCHVALLVTLAMTVNSFSVALAIAVTQGDLYLVSKETP